MTRLLNMGHRGARYSAPENTISSFQHAVNSGADYLELDVRLTKDKQIVVIHDSRINRVSSGRGKIRNYTLEQLRQFDFGSWFGSDFLDERIPTLQEVFDAFPDTGMNIEIKSHRMESYLVEFLKANPRPNIIISSFFFSVLKRVRRLNPDLQVGIIISQKFGWRKKLKKASQYDFFSVHMEQRLIDERVMEILLKSGLHMYPWSKVPMDEGMIHRLIELGVNGFISDSPGLVQKVLDGLP